MATKIYMATNQKVIHAAHKYDALVSMLMRNAPFVEIDTTDGKRLVLNKVHISYIKE